MIPESARPHLALPPRGWWPLLGGLLVYAVVLCVVVVVRAESSSDFRDYWRTAAHLRETGQISSELGVHNYLPFFPIFMLPWSLLPLQVAIVGFTVLSLACLALTVALVERLLNGRFGASPRRALLATVGLMLAYVHSCGVLGAVELLLLLLIVATWFLVERGDEWAAGLTLGLAALLKVVPALLIVFFLLKRRWRVAGAALGSMLLLGLGLPLFSLGWRETVAQHRGFVERAVIEHSARATLTADQPRKLNFTNNALPAVLRRLLTRTNAAPSPTGTQLYVNVADLPRDLLLALYAVLVLIFVGVSGLVSLRGSPRWPPESLGELRALRWQYGVWCALLLLLTPLFWTRYLLLAYWPLALLADRAERTARADHRPCRASMLVLLIWLVGVAALAWPAARAVGAQLLCALATWTGLIWLLLRGAEKPTPTRPEPLQPGDAAG